MTKALKENYTCILTTDQALRKFHKKLMQLKGFKLQIKNLLGSDENMGCRQMKNKATIGVLSGIKSGRYFFKSRSLRPSWIGKL